MKPLRVTWETYSGWMTNIGRRNEGELASVRARLSAAGAAPDQIKMQTEFLEAQRKKDIAEVQGTSIYRQLSDIYGKSDKTKTFEEFFSSAYGKLSQGTAYTKPIAEARKARLPLSSVADSANPWLSQSASPSWLEEN